MSAVVQKMIDHIAAADRDKARAEVVNWVKENGIEHVAERILIPMLDKFTEQMVSESDAPLARAYVAAKVAEDIMGLIAEAVPPNPAQDLSRGVVVLGNIEDDFHALGRRIVATFLRARGWQVVDLGNDIPAAQFVDAAEKHAASVIGVSAMMYTTAQNIKKVRDELDRRGLHNRIKLAVGGAIFVLRPELVAEVGGDGTSRTALGAPELIDVLSKAAHA